MVTVMTAREADLAIEHQGAVVVFDVLSPEADAWALGNDNLEGWLWLGRHRFAVDTRISASVLQQALAHGLTAEA